MKLDIEVTCEQRGHSGIGVRQTVLLAQHGALDEEFHCPKPLFSQLKTKAFGIIGRLETAHTVYNTELTVLMPDQHGEALSKHEVVVITLTTTTAVIIILSSSSVLPLSLYACAGHSAAS